MVEPSKGLSPNTLLALDPSSLVSATLSLKYGDLIYHIYHKPNRIISLLERSVRHAT